MLPHRFWLSITICPLISTRSLSIYTIGSFPSFPTLSLTGVKVLISLSACRHACLCRHPVHTKTGMYAARVHIRIYMRRLANQQGLNLMWFNFNHLCWELVSLPSNIYSVTNDVDVQQGYSSRIGRGPQL